MTKTKELWTGLETSRLPPCNPLPWYATRLLASINIVSRASLPWIVRRKKKYLCYTATPILLLNMTSSEWICLRMSGRVLTLHSHRFISICTCGLLHRCLMCRRANQLPICICDANLLCWCRRNKGRPAKEWKGAFRYPEPVVRPVGLESVRKELSLLV